MGRSGVCLILIATLAACKPQNVPEQTDPTPITASDGTVVFETDSDEWHVYVFARGVLYGSGYSVDSPYHIPTRDEAYVLKKLTFGSNEQRYVTCDGYTFGMPSASVTKAGTKTKYSVLWLWRRQTTYFVPF